jgi:hypothetical protein
MYDRSANRTRRTLAFMAALGQDLLGVEQVLVNARDPALQGSSAAPGGAAPGPDRSVTPMC